jgi:hypothetical protein
MPPQTPTVPSTYLMAGHHPIPMLVLFVVTQLPALEHFPPHLHMNVPFTVIITTSVEAEEPWQERGQCSRFHCFLITAWFSFSFPFSCLAPWKPTSSPLTVPLPISLLGSVQQNFEIYKWKFLIREPQSQGRTKDKRMERLLRLFILPDAKQHCSGLRR